jgi:hypothetical protein
MSDLFCHKVTKLLTISELLQYRKALHESVMLHFGGKQCLANRFILTKHLRKLTQTTLLQEAPGIGGKSPLALARSGSGADLYRKARPWRPQKNKLK